MTQNQAEKAARTIMKFWADLGYQIEVHVFRVKQDTHSKTMWGVKSNLRNGLPPAGAEYKTAQRVMAKLYRA